MAAVTQMDRYESDLARCCTHGRNQGRVVSLSVLSPHSACVRLRQLREVHHSLQHALSPWSRTQSAATDGSPARCTSSLMLRVCVMLRVLYPLNPPCVRCLCCCKNVLSQTLLMKTLVRLIASSVSSYSYICQVKRVHGSHDPHHSSPCTPQHGRT